MNLDAIRKQADLIGALRSQLREAEDNIAKVSGLAGQSTGARVTVNGVSFDILQLNTAYMPEVIRGCELIQREAVRLLTLRRDSIKSRLEGAEWKLGRLVKGAA